MKKLIIICVISTFTNSVFAQKWENYLQLGVGTGYLVNADINDTPFLQFEYGKTYRWLDIGAALEYANSSTYNNKYCSLVLKTKFDVVRMFSKNSHHSFKLGTGVGIGTANLDNWYEIPYNHSQKYSSANYTLYSVMASYEYKIADKTSLGVFFNNYTSDTFFGLHYLGLCIRRNF